MKMMQIHFSGPTLFYNQSYDEYYKQSWKIVPIILHRVWSNHTDYICFRYSPLPQSFEGIFLSPSLYIAFLSSLCMISLQLLAWTNVTHAIPVSPWLTYSILHWFSSAWFIHIYKSFCLSALTFTHFIPFSQFSSVSQSCLTLCDPMNCSMTGLPVHHQLLEFTQTHVHRIGDAPSNHFIICCPLLLPSSIFPSIRVFSKESDFCIRWPNGVSASASVLSINIQDWFSLGWTSRISLQFKGLSRVFSNATVQKHQFLGTLLSL